MINKSTSLPLLILIILNIIGSGILISQDYTNEDATRFFAQTKQVNQFIKRFNGEENLKGEKINPDDNKYRSKDLRFRYFQMIFDEGNKNVDETLKQDFIKKIVMQKPEFLSFYDDDWYAEISTKFDYAGTKVDIIFFLKIEKENDGYKWVIVNLYFDKFDKFFYQHPDSTHKFIHPMSHELDFMNLHKVFDDAENIEYYYDKDYVPDYKTLFLFEIKNKTLHFSEVTGVKFHFFSIENYYFEITNFKRNSYNSGWLVSNLLAVKEAEKKNMIEQITGKVK